MTKKVIIILTRMIQNWTSTPSKTMFSWNKYPDFIEKLLFSWGEDFILGLMLRKKPRGIFLCLGRFVSYHMFEIYINVLLNEREWWLWMITSNEIQFDILIGTHFTCTHGENRSDVVRLVVFVTNTFVTNIYQVLLW